MLHRKHRLITRVSRWAFWLATAGNSLGALWGKMPEENYGPAYAWMRAAGEHYSGRVVWASALVLACATFLLKRYGSHETWDTLHELISGLRSAVFKGAGFENPDHHKVTIFRVSYTCPTDNLVLRMWQACTRTQKWLVPMVRSHHTSQKTTTCFSLSDDSANCFGVAGQAYAKERVVSIDGLPDVSTSPSAKDVKAYSQSSYVTKEWVQDKKPKARSVLALPLTVEGAVWGVLVFDSRLPAKIKYDELADIFEVIQKHINRLLTKHLA